MNVRLTEKFAAAAKLPAGKKDFTFWDDKIAMFGLRLREGGSKTWIFWYWVGTTKKKMTLGSWPALTADKARKAAGDGHADVRLEGDPAAAKAKNRERVDDTFGKILIENYLPKCEAKLRPRSYDEVKRHLMTNCKGLHDKRIDLISKRDYAEELNKLSRTKVARNRTRASLVAFVNWSVGEGYLEHNNAAYTNKDDERSRTRMLFEPEIRTLWEKLEEYGRREDRGGEGGDDYRDIVRLLILTGARASEIGSLERKEVKLGENLIHLPGTRTKNGLPWIIPMSAPVRAILERRMKEGDPKRECLFGTGKGGFSGWSKAKTGLDELVGFVDEWHIHDLRRTLSSTLNAAPLSVAPHVVEACLNHVSGRAKAGVAGVYNVYEYLPEKTAALEAWAGHVMKVVAKVTSLEAERKKRKAS